MRAALTLFVAAGVSAWATAQAPVTGPTAAEQLGMLQMNRGLVESLIERGVELSDADSPLARAEKCRLAAVTLSGALADELKADAPNADRVAELGDHLGVVLGDGLADVLGKAREAIPPGSPGFEKLQEFEEKAAKVAPADGAVGRLPQVQAARRKLAAGRPGGGGKE